jgi:hypothetical protein
MDGIVHMQDIRWPEVEERMTLTLLDPELTLSVVDSNTVVELVIVAGLC